MNEAPIPVHSHAAWDAQLRQVNDLVGQALARCRALGVPWTVQLAGLHETANLVRVANTPLPDLVAAADRFPSARLGGAELGELVARRLGEGWPVDGKPLA